jgi:hypothetical protein
MCVTFPLDLLGTFTIFNTRGPSDYHSGYGNSNYYEILLYDYE